MNKGKQWICTKQWRKITVGTIVYILPIGKGHYAASYTVTPEFTQRSRIANFTTIKEYFREYKEEK